jgi:hypothetical protein
MNWNDPVERLALIESVGVAEYNLRLSNHHESLESIYPVWTRFGQLFAVKDTKMAFSTQAQALAHLASIGGR